MIPIFTIVFIIIWSILALLFVVVLFPSIFFPVCDYCEQLYITDSITIKTFKEHYYVGAIE